MHDADIGKVAEPLDTGRNQENRFNANLQAMYMQ